MSVGVTISCGNHEIIQSGSLLVRSGESVSLQLGSSDNGFKIELGFIDAEGSTSRVQMLSGNDFVKIGFVNYRNRLGIATTDPIKVAVMSGRDVYLSVYTSYLENEGSAPVRLVNYMLGLGFK